MAFQEQAANKWAIRLRGRCVNGPLAIFSHSCLHPQEQYIFVLGLWWNTKLPWCFNAAWSWYAAGEFAPLGVVEFQIFVDDLAEAMAGRKQSGGSWTSRILQGPGVQEGTRGTGGQGVQHGLLGHIISGWPESVRNLGRKWRMGKSQWGEWRVSVSFKEIALVQTIFMLGHDKS